MSNRPLRIPPELKTILDGTGLPWRIENGHRHHKIYVADRLVTVVSFGIRTSRKNKDFNQVRCTVNRFTRSLATC